MIKITFAFCGASTVHNKLLLIGYVQSCVRHQAIRTLRELAEREKEKYPDATDIIIKDTYIYDVLAGAETEDSVIFKQFQLMALCKSGQFELRKCASNSQKIPHAVLAESRSMYLSVLFDGM